MISLYRMLYYIGLVVIEATPSALLLTIVGVDAWGALMLVVIAGIVADWVVLRRLPPAYQRPALAVAGMLAALWLVKVQVDGASPLAGWGAAFDALGDLAAHQSIAVYLCLLVGLYCFWRGTRLTQHDSVTLHWLFRLSIVWLIVVIFVRFFVRGSGLALAPLATGEVLTFFAVALLTIALASASEEREIELRRMGWRGLATLAGSVALVMVAGVLVGSLFGREAAALVRLIWQGVVFAVLLMAVPFIYIVASLVEWLVRLLNMQAMLNGDNPLSQLDQILRQQYARQPVGELPAWADLLLRVFCAVVPILLVVSLFLIGRRRRTRTTGADEERESLWSWDGLASDLAGLLAGLRAGKRSEGLRDALARLRGDDPISRIRRSYIKLLLIGEERSLPRQASQTPQEYTPNARALLPAAAQPVATLTEAYERARYNPAGVSGADADAAERASGAIEQADSQARGKKR